MEILTATSGFFYEIKLGREVYAVFGAKAPYYGKPQPGHQREQNPPKIGGFLF